MGDKKISYIISCIDRGMNIAEIADDLDCTQQNVSQLLKSRGINYQKIKLKYQRKHKKRVHHLLDRGMNYTEISSTLGISCYHVSKYASGARPSVYHRMARRVSVNPDTACWELPPTNHVISRTKVRDWRYNATRYSYVISWEHHNKQLVPDGCYVLHKCDNPLCINPGHLYVGTPEENCRDRDVAMGRRDEDRPLPEGWTLDMVSWNGKG